MHFSSILRNTVSIAILAFFSQITLANDDLSADEKNSMIKEDVASIQVLQEFCPSILGKNANFDSKIQKLLTQQLNEYVGGNMTLDLLKQEKDYQNILKSTQKALSETSADDNKMACEEILNLDI